jgi:hypothetical protein
LVDQTEFQLQAVQSLSGFIRAVDDIIPGHPFRFIIEDIFPTGGQEGLAMLLYGSMEKAISKFLRFFKYHTPGSRKGARGEIKDKFPVGSKSLKQ